MLANPQPHSPNRALLDGLIRLSLRNRAIVLVLAALLLVFGLFTWRQLPIEVLPDMTKPTVTILTECPGLAPEEVETLVTQPIESAMQGIGGMDRLRSNSDVGLSLVFVEFDWNAEILRCRQLVQERLQSVLTTLPSQSRVGLTPISSLMGEILLVGLRCQDGSVAPMALRTLADKTVRRRLQSIPGVAEVLAIGGGVKQIHVQPDPSRLAAFGLTMDDLSEAMARAAGTATSGYLQAGPKEIMVRNLAMTTDLEELGNTVIKIVGDRPVILTDVATLQFAPQLMRGDAAIALDGDEGETMGVVLSVDKAPGFDTLKLTAEVEKARQELAASLPPGVEMVILFRQGDFIEYAMTNLKDAIIHGAIMVAVVLFLFLLNLRTTAITLTAIPLSFAIAVLVFRLCDVSVNSMTLGGLAVAIGMVVDDAIVDVENVYRRLKENAASATPRERLEVIAAASSEVRNSILYATVIIMLVFIPLLGLQGLEGRLFGPIAIATMVSMAASFIVSLTVIPVLCSVLLRPKGAATGHADTPVVRWMKVAVRHSFLRGAFAAPLVVLAGAALLLIGALGLYPSMGKEFHRQGRPRDVVFDEIRTKLKQLPGTFPNVGQPIGHRLSHMLSGVSAKIAVKVFGPDLDVLRKKGEEIRDLAKEVPGLTDVLLEPQVPIPQLRVEVDRKRAMAYGIQPGRVNEQVSAMLGGAVLAELREGQQSVELVLRLPESWRSSPERLGDILLETAHGPRIPLRMVARIIQASGPNVINRENNQRRVVVGANTSQRDIEGLVRQWERLIREKINLPEGYFWRMEGEYQAQKAASQRILFFFALVVAVVAVLLQGYFRSFSLALQVMLNLPLALLGALVSTKYLIGNISIATLVGFIAVGGVAARNGIMMLSHYLHLMKHEGEKFGIKMITRGTLERLVPVLMTALAAGIALIPLVRAAQQPGTEILHPVAVAIVGGLISSTTLDLIVTPALFFFFGRQAAEKALRLGAPAAH